jgi:hypothetical protein
MSKPENKGIWQYWQALAGMASFLIGVGIFYAKTEAQSERIKNAELRQDRQFELIQTQEKRIIELEKRTEYYKGLRDGRNEKNQP